MKQPCVYIITNDRNGTLYIGVTSNLIKRIWEHKNQFIEGFSHSHQLTQLVYFETHQSMYQAITREKQLKHWKREWKIQLIEQENPYWQDLWETLM
ncbi:GIY-YIG nuclease family protein [Ferrimonas sp. SCSIO 43195]|uniref:GIY-YIG nuclease family protein n=1 Tax=Ferrimonas sp. SCSIO 43195 TaxID=2822844 RepID=UPI002075E9B4|nr:GIY-YIG nuclease family protein [Ferrimonas sp. SCSIO 43195]USD38690.1 GIY-YIG nuclease family protein [Ferrimonas sp. SCSIO 43195]